MSKAKTQMTVIELKYSLTQSYWTDEAHRKTRVQHRENAQAVIKNYESTAYCTNHPVLLKYTVDHMMNE